MSESPYHYPGHIEAYDTVQPTKEYAEISIVFAALEKLLYYPDSNIPRVQRSRADNTQIMNFFNCQYMPIDERLWLAPNELVRVDVEHGQFLGKSAIKEYYKLQVTSHTFAANGNTGAIVNRYYMQRVAGVGKIYSGSVLRANILAENNLAEEQMTVYDCEILYDQIYEAAQILDISASVN